MLLPPTLDLRTISRWPTTLSAATIDAVQSLPIPWADGRLPDEWHPLAGSRQRAVGGNPLLPTAYCLPPTDAPAASIIVLTYNNLPFTRMCLESLLPHTTEVDYELILVDNNSTDGTREYLTSLASAANQRSTIQRVRLLFNDQNVGFARACNQGLKMARGDSLVFLNNDTILPPRWLSRLLAWLDDENLGLVGPVTNRIGNEAQIPVTYRTLSEYFEFAAAYTSAHRAESMDIRTATMFCAAMRRDVYDKAGPLDEQFGLALCEDDDYSMRIRQCGLAVKCVEDVFVHHFGQASVGQLEARYGELSHANRKRWEAKWNRPWQSYTLRPNAAYQDLVTRIAEVAVRNIPSESRTLVVSKGDDALLAGIGRHAQHFPQDRCGQYVGYNPKDSAEAIEQLECLRAQGAVFFLLPAAYFWWLEHYADLASHLKGHFRVVYEDRDTCLIFSLV
jgi:GT2 family glycosyltransferase